METHQRNRIGETMSETNSVKRVRIAGRPFELRRDRVVLALSDVDPEPIASHFVVIGSRRYPPKQVISELTGLDRADFTTHQARRTLLGLGFSAGRRGAGRARPDAGTTESGGLGERLLPMAGQWVAIKDDDILHASQTPADLVSWLARHGQRADSMFRVPEDARAETGLAPL
jgi:hypothetical protein